MVQAVSSNSRVAPVPPPPESIINTTLDPIGDRVAYGLENIYTGPEVEAFKTVFTARHLIANEIQRLLTILDAIDGDDDLEMNVPNAYDNPALEDAEGLQVSSCNGSYVADEDAELDAGESGIGDLDGLFEQIGRAA